MKVIRMYSRCDDIDLSKPILMETKQGIKLLGNGVATWNTRMLKCYATLISGTFDEKVKTLEDNDNGMTYMSYSVPHFVAIVSDEDIKA